MLIEGQIHVCVQCKCDGVCSLLSVFAACQMCECYSSVSEWQELEAWLDHVKTLQGQANGGPDTSSAFSIHYDVNHLRYIHVCGRVNETGFHFSQRE